MFTLKATTLKVWSELDYWNWAVARYLLVTHISTIIQLQSDALDHAGVGVAPASSFAQGV